ncbi:MAG: hypothetical protein WBG92_20805 [Thiohalocapsa sp.]
MNTAVPSFKVSAESLQRRTNNVLYGVGLSLLLVLLVGWGHLEQPQTYNDVLLWSVVGFVLLANLIGYLRHRRYLRLAQDHRLELGPDFIGFQTGSENSRLALADIASVTVHRRRRHIGHIQIQRTDNRGIRLEDYGNMEGLSVALKDLVPAAHWRDG